MTHLWLLDVPGPDAAEPGDPRRLTDGDKFTVNGFSWSPDSARIAFSAQRDPDLGSADTADIYVVTLADRAVKKSSARRDQMVLRCGRRMEMKSRIKPRMEASLISTRII